VKLSGRQLAIMRVLWDRGEGTVADVQQALDLEKPLAYSTVATVMSRMKDKGLLVHRSEGRVFHFRPAISENGAGSSMIGELVDRVFGGSPAELVNHLLKSEHVDSTELTRIRKIVRQHEKKNAQRKGDKK